MPTVNQLIKNPRKPQKRKTRTKALEGNCFKRGVCTWVGIREPKKPNSAERKCCRVRLTNGKEILCFIPGVDHNLVEHSEVLVRGAKCPDLPGVKYAIVRGKHSCSGVIQYNDEKKGVKPRNQSRSKYGVKRPKGDK